MAGGIIASLASRWLTNKMDSRLEDENLARRNKFAFERDKQQAAFEDERATQAARTYLQSVGNANPTPEQIAQTKVQFGNSSVNGGFSPTQGAAYQRAVGNIKAGVPMVQSETDAANADSERRIAKDITPVRVSADQIRAAGELRQAPAENARNYLTTMNEVSRQRDVVPAQLKLTGQQTETALQNEPLRGEAERLGLVSQGTRDTYPFGMSPSSPLAARLRPGGEIGDVVAAKNPTYMSPFAKMNSTMAEMNRGQAGGLIPLEGGGSLRVPDERKPAYTGEPKKEVTPSRVKVEGIPTPEEKFTSKSAPQGRTRTPQQIKMVEDKEKEGKESRIKELRKRLSQANTGRGTQMSAEMYKELYDELISLTSK